MSAGAGGCPGTLRIRQQSQSSSVYSYIDSVLPYSVGEQADSQADKDAPAVHLASAASGSAPDLASVPSAAIALEATMAPAPAGVRSALAPKLQVC
jgi:hypothetical protein